MNIIKIWSGTASDSQLRNIAKRLKNGEIGIIPTDTTYAIVGNALNVKAVEAICKLKRINPDKSNLSILCSDISMAAEYSRIENFAFKLIKDHTPGAFTFLLKSASKLPRAFKGRKIVGVRIPEMEFDRELCRIMGNPLLSTSIEYEDDDHAVNPGLIAETYEGKLDFMVEGDEGTTDKSTIVDCTDSTLEVLRQGKGILD